MSADLAWNENAFFLYSVVAPVVGNYPVPVQRQGC